MTQRIPNTHQPIFSGQSWDERQLAILVGLVVAACREVLQSANGTVTSTDSNTSIKTPQTTPCGTMASHATTATPGILGQSETVTVPEPKLLLTVEEAAARLSVGRPKMWQLVMQREVLSLKIGASRRVPVAALEDYVQRLSAAEQAEQTGRTSTVQRAERSERSETYGN